MEALQTNPDLTMIEKNKKKEKKKKKEKEQREREQKNLMLAQRLADLILQIGYFNTHNRAGQTGADTETNGVLPINGNFWYNLATCSRR